MNVAAHQEKKKKETKKDKRRAGEKRERKQATISRKLCAALLRSFRGKHSEKMKGSAWGNWDPWEVQQPFRPNPNGVGDRTTTLRRLLIGAVTSSTDRKADFFLSVLASFKILFIVEDFNYHHSLCDSKVISVPVMRKYLIGSSLRTSFSSIIPILPLFSISPLAVAPLLTSSLLPTLCRYLKS